MVQDATDSTAQLPKLRFPQFWDSWHEMPLKEFATPITEQVGSGDCVPYTVTAGMGLVSQEEKFGRTIAGNSLPNYIRLEKDDFAYNKSATKAFPEGFIARYVDDVRAAVPNSIFTCFRVDPEKVVPAYLDALFAGNLHGRWLRNFITVGARAHGSLNVSDRDLMSLPVPVPSVLEQQKIADCLTSLDEVIAAQGRKVEALKAHKKGLTQQLFPREGETLPRLRFPEFRDAGVWEEKRIADLAPFVTSGSRGWADYYAGSGSLFVRITNLSRDSIKLELTDLKFVSLPPEATEGVRTRLKVRDVLVSITADVGIVGYVDADVPSPAYINQHVALIRFDEDVCAKFVAYFLSTEMSQRGFRAATDSGTKAGMNLTAVQNMPLVLPDRPEQHRIAECLSSLDARIATEAGKLAAMQTHKNGLLQQLFPPVGDSQ